MKCNLNHPTVQAAIKHWEEEIVAMEVAMENQEMSMKLLNAKTPEQIRRVFAEYR